MGFYDTRILPRLLDLAMSTHVVRDERRRCLRDVAGEVLEVGFGTGRNLPYYPETVTRIVGVDPSVASAGLARARIAASPIPVEVIGLSAERLPVRDASFDAVVSTFTLCSIPDALQALREMRRALRPGGRLYFVEHGRADDPGVRRWQDRLNGLQRIVFGGCNLNRDISGLIAQAGFSIEKMEHAYLEGAPKCAGYLFRGVATNG